MKTSRRIILAAGRALASAHSHAGEARMAVGAFMRAQPQYGLRFVTWTDEWETVAGTAVSETTTTKIGPTLNYLFTPESRGSWYLCASLLQWTQDEKSSRTGYYNLGMYFSPAKLSTQTSDTAEETTGADVQLQLGFAF